MRTGHNKTENDMHPTFSLKLTIVMVAICCCFCILCGKAEEHQKRIPTGFTGTRGKKSIIYSEQGPSDGIEDGTNNNNVVDGVDDNPTIIEKRAPSGFMGMRGKKPYPVLWEDDIYPDGMYKRAPSGFMGMRGKKDIEFTSLGDDYNKRAPSGFMGMRGKKTAIDGDDMGDDFYKRAPMGFVGMRGKKDYNVVGDDAKRAPSGFFGMRGKKQPRQSGFFGMRGKKFPYELRGKFVGVRGKKVVGPDYGQNLDLQQLMVLLTNQQQDNDVWNLIDEYNQ